MAAVSPKPNIQGPKSSGVVVPEKPTRVQRLVALLVYVLARTVTATLRFKWNDRSGFFSNPPAGQAIYCIWHNRLALCMSVYAYGRKHNNTQGLVVLVSASTDGGLLSAIFEKFGVQPVRGSSSRRGPQSLRELTTWARRGYDLGITPDGPRGPRYSIQDGVMSLAQLTGLPIIPISYRLGWKIRLKSWDQFQIPLPFSRCEMIYEKPIRVPREVSADQRELLRQELEQKLREISID